MSPTICFIAFLFVTVATFPCSQYVIPPAGPDAGVEVAFSGIVVGYTTATTEIFGAAKPAGLLIRVLEPLISSAINEEFEVYLFGSAPDCSPISRSMDDLIEQYPKESVVTVIGDKFDLPSDLQNTRPILTSKVDSFGHVGHVPNAVPRTKDGFLDFVLFKQTYEAQGSKEFSFPIAWRNAHRKWFEDYEFLRFLMVLASDIANPNKIAMLHNMASYSGYNSIATDIARARYKELIRHFGISGSAKRQLLLYFDKCNSKSHI